jgi:hypothetical protein
MTTTYITDLITRARYHLKDASKVVWSDNDLTDYIKQAVGDLSAARPYEQTGTVYFRGGTRDLDLGVLSSLPSKVVRVEYDVDQDPREFRNFTTFGNAVTVELSTLPTGDVGVSGKASGTTANKLVDATLSQFTTSMVYALVTNDTDGTSTYITARDSTSILSVADDIFVAGDVYTVYERVNARLYYEGKHTYDETTRTFPPEFEDIILDGIVAYAIQRLASGYAAVKLAAGITSLEAAATAIALVSARVTQAISDINTARDNISVRLVIFDAEIDNMTARLANAAALIGSGDDYITTVNVADEVPQNYAAYAQQEVNNAAGSLEKARGALEQAAKDASYVDVATAELQAATTRLQEATANLSAATGYVNIATTMENLRYLSEDQMLLYKTRLRGLRKLKAYKDYPAG